MGVNQSTVGTLKNRAILNLCLATGNIGRPGSGPLSLTGQPNAMGGRETGGLARAAARLPQGRRTPRTARRCGASGARRGIAPEPGIAATELVEALEDGRVKVLWIVATNPVVSQPDAGRFAAALRARRARDLPGRLLPDRDRRARARAAARRAVAGEGRDDDELRAARVAGARARSTRPARRCRTGRSSRASGARSASARRSRGAAPRRCTPSTCARPRAGCATRPGISHARLRRDGPLQWPCPSRRRTPAPSGSTARAASATPDGRARLAPTPHTAPADPVDADFPLVLTTGRVAQQWHTMTRTGKSPSLLDAEPQPFLELHPATPAGLRRRRARARALAARLGGAARCGSPTRVPPGRRVRAVSLGRAAPRAGRGRAEQRDLARGRSGLAAARAEGVRGAGGAGRRARSRRRAGGAGS